MKAFGMPSVSQDLVTVFHIFLSPFSRIPVYRFNICLDVWIPNHSIFIVHCYITSHLMWHNFAPEAASWNNQVCIIFYSSDFKDSDGTTLEYMNFLVTAVAQWLRCCATNRKVAGSIPDGVIGIFYWHNPSDRTMSLGSTQPLTEMSTRRISWG